MWSFCRDSCCLQQLSVPSASLPLCLLIAAAEYGSEEEGARGLVALSWQTVLPTQTTSVPSQLLRSDGSLSSAVDSSCVHTSTDTQHISSEHAAAAAAVRYAGCRSCDCCTMGRPPHTSLLLTGAPLAAAPAAAPRLLQRAERLQLRNSAAWRQATVARPDPALYELGNTQYNATLCLYTFAQLQEAFTNHLPCYHLMPIMLISCPQHCLRAVDTSPSPLVSGSYPYHNSSSVCLAAIHAGIISDEAGGGVFAERFYPLTWANDSTQSIFPHGSQAASLSNGVQTAAVPEEATRTPALLDSYSWTVRARGLTSRQQQLAPFSPRAGHTHITLARVVEPNFAGQHLIIGGHNATHRFNDVWLFQVFHEPDTVLDQQARNGRWLRLPDAPFTPRSEMAAHWLPATPDLDLFKLRTAWTRTRLLLFYGGQTGDSCGSRILGECSDEVWQLNVTFTSDTSGPDIATLGAEYTWSLAGRLTFGARCGLTLIVDQRWLTTGQMRIVGLAGGQLSYADSEHCAARIETRNDVWYSSWPDLFSWRQGRDAPFSPRRSMQEDDAYVNSDVGFVFNAASVVNRTLVPPKSTSLAGGIRYLDHRIDNATGRAIVTRAEMYADVFSCTLPTPEYQPNATLDCDWAHSSRLANTSIPPPYPPTGSLPLPAAYGASSGMYTTWYNSRVRWGGASSGAALTAWLSTTPTGVADAVAPVDWSLQHGNVSMVLQPIFMEGKAAGFYAGGSATGSVGEVMSGRYDLPLAYTLDEAELNSATSDFALGSAAVLTHLLTLESSSLQPHLTTLHLQPQQMAQTPEEATDAVPQAASALNTTRPAFGFSMRRRGHTQRLTLDTTYIVAGQSGSVYSNEWISSTAQGCLWPMDPSYRSLLGPLSSARLVELMVWAIEQHSTLRSDATWMMLWQVPMHSPFSSLRVHCAAGHHFSPPQQDDSALLTCTGAALWLDLTLGAVRRCVPDALQCDWPFADIGVGHCVDPEPEVTSIMLRMTANSGHVDRQPHNFDNASVVDLPVQWQVGERQLFVIGRWLTTPLTISVVGQTCWPPKLHDAIRHCSADGRLCRWYSTAASCTMTQFNGWALGAAELPVEVAVGRRQRTFSSLNLPVAISGASFLSTERLVLVLAAPIIVSLQSADCSLNSTALELLDCPADREFQLHVCVDNLPQWPSNQPRLSLSSSSEMQCGGLGYWNRELVPTPSTDCIDYVITRQCWITYLCADCRVQPMVGAGHVLRIVLNNGLSNEQQINAANSTTPRVSFAVCAAGSRAVLLTAADGNTRQQCVECEPGYSTNGLSDQRSCTPCAPGSYSSVSGSAVCLLCPLGTAASQQNSTACTQCGANSWSRYEGAHECNECGEAQYKRLSPQLNASVAEHELPVCESCSAGAQCERNGSILARQGSFLTIDSQTGAVSSVSCGVMSCVDVAASAQCQLAAAAFDNPDEQAAAQRIGPTGPAVINCCGVNRQPAVDAAGNVNVLCAACVEGYSVVQAECIACSSVQVAPLLALLLAAFLLTYVLHRLFNDASGRATLPILTYFVQMSTLFLGQDALPALLGLASLDLVAEGGAGGGSDALRSCMVPLSDGGKMLVRLFSPAVFCALLLALLGLQLAVRQAVNSSQWMQRQAWLVSAYRLLLPAVSEAGVAAQPSSAPAGIVWSGQTASEAKRSSARQLPKAELSEPLIQQDEADSEPAAASLPSAATSLSGDSVPGILAYYRRTLLRLALYSYNTVTLVSLAAFRTVDVGEYGSRVRQYPAVSIYSAEYRSMATLFVFMLVVVVAGGPIAMSAYLTRCYLEAMWEGRSRKQWTTTRLTSRRL